MKFNTLPFLFLVLLLLLNNKSESQSVMNPNDSLVQYDPANPPQQPTYGQIGKWARTKSMSWNTNSYKAYIYKGFCFRLKFPKTYNPTANDGIKYPLAIVFHGGGEAGPITDNETQLFHGGQPYLNAVNNGTFDGYVIFPQSQGLWGPSSYQLIIEIIKYMITNNKLDPFRVSVNGLSSGGQASWDMIINYPSYIAASLPMSNISIGYRDTSVVNKVKFTPMWDFQGALDGSPDPSTADQVYAAMNAAGANYKYTIFANTAHNTWDSSFAQPGFFQYMANAYSSNPWPLFGKTTFCNGDTVNETLGVAPGFQQYQWRKNDTVISTAITNTLRVNAFGKYDARVLNNGVWSDWSHVPVYIQINPPTVAPPIQTAGAMSYVLPDAGGKNFVNLTIPDSGYTSYTWKKVGSDSVLSKQSIFTATQPGSYIVAVTKKYTCTSVYSQPFVVVNAKGLNAPPPVTNVIANSLSSTDILINWENNPHPQYNEIAFEVYRSNSQAGTYSYIGSSPADSVNYLDSKLSPGIQYFYKIRAINYNGASTVSPVVSAITSVDSIPPTAPDSLQIVYSTSTSVNLKWKSSFDKVGLFKYNIYINNVKSYSTTDTSFIANGLQTGKTYSFYVTAIDSSNNTSTPSNMVSTQASLNGLVLKYYEGLWSKLPNFNQLPALNTYIVNNINLNLSNRQEQFGMLWQGYLQVPFDGVYKIQTVSDDGSMLWLNKYDPSLKPLISNDGTRPFQRTVTATVTLKKGSYPISVAYFQFRTDKSMQVKWSNKDVYGDSAMHLIDNKYFVGTTINSDSIPPAPGSLSASALSYTSINLTWADLSSKETNFQVFRSTASNGSYNIIGTLPANSTRFTDSNLNDNTTYFYKINAVNNFGTSLNSNIASATTINLPAPAAPTQLSATAISPTSIQLKWTDNATNEVNYQILRSVSDSFHFKIAAVKPANTTSFVDDNLYGNSIYYYKVKAINALKAATENSKATMAITKNSAPVISNKFTQQNVRYAVKSTVVINATDADGDALKFYTANMPAFASLLDNNNGSATLTFNAASNQAGTYNNIKVYVRDSLNAVDSFSFSVVVNSNYNPVIDSIKNYTINEGGSITIPLTAVDNNAGDSLRWTITNIPNKYNVIGVSKKAANLVIIPNYTSAGEYLVTVNTNDAHGGINQRQFNLSVIDKDPNQVVYIRFQDQNGVGAPWNNITGNNSSNLKDNLNRTTSIGLNMQAGWYSTWHEGPQTGNNSGVYPDSVLKEYYYFGTFGGPDVVTNKITGLDTSKMYSISFYSGSIWSQAANNGTTVFTIGSQTKSLAVQNNTNNTADFTALKPAADGSVTFTLSKGANTPSGYLNAIKITYLYQDKAKPAAPTALSATNDSVKGVDLTWKDVAYNESTYQLYRSDNPNNNFKVVSKKIPFNATSFVDTTVKGNTAYYYKIQAANNNGLSDFSNIANVITKDAAPVINAIADIIIKNNQQLSLKITAKDDTADHITLTSKNLPSFIKFIDNGNGTGVINIAPNFGTTGTFNNVTITATDKSDSSASTSFNVTVTDNGVNSIYVNFTKVDTASGYWNNFKSFPSPGVTLSNLKDDNNSITPVSLKIVNGFLGQFLTGMQPGNGQNIYPQQVLSSGLYDTSSTKTDSILISGLAANKKYSFVFFNSNSDGSNGSTNFSANGNSVTLNASYNINKTVQVNGITPDASGNVYLKISKVSGAARAYLNALIIQTYDSTKTLATPSDFRVTGVTRSTVSLQWADRSYNETGFEIWRAADSTQTYSLVKTLPANSTSYQDSNLYSDKTYYYSIRAINGSASSGFCNSIAATTCTQAIYVNFTFANAAGSPWNNTNALPELGDEFANLNDDLGTPSNVSLQLTGIFAGIYGPGMNTGKDSGIYPDKVLADNYGLFTNQSASLKISGLNYTKKYNFTFFASAQLTGDVNTAFTINQTRAVLNAALNTNGTVTIYNVSPDKNGEVNIGIISASLSSQFGLIGSLVVQEFTPNNDSIPVPSFANKTISNAPVVQEVIQSKITNDVENLKSANVYPNPFTSYFTATFNLEQVTNVELMLNDLKGNVVYQNKYNNLLKGTNTLQVTPGRNLAAGIYILRILDITNKKMTVLKVVKQ